LLVIGYSLV